MELNPSSGELRFVTRCAPSSRRTTLAQHADWIFCPGADRSLSQSQAAIDSDHLAGHPFRSGADKLDDPFCYIVRDAASSERYARAFLFLDCRSLFWG
jgi:hypothetical protein